MNHYPSWWNSTVTIFNKVKDDKEKVKWFTKVLNDCFYKHTVEKIIVGNTTISSNASVCRIRVSDSFLAPDAYMKLQESERADYFTLKVGDIVVFGEVDDRIDEYVTGKRSADLVKKYKEWPGCFTIETVNINVGGGRGNEHYHVRGT